MGILSDWWNRGRQPAPSSSKLSEFTEAITRDYPHLQPIWTPWNILQFYRSGYQRNPYIYTAIRMVSQGAAQVPFTVMKTSARMGGQPQEVPDHPMVQLLNRPNPSYGRDLLIEGAHAYRLLAGNSYLELPSANPNRPPVEVWTARADRMRVLNGDGMNPVAGYEYQAGGEVVRKLGAESVMHWRTFNADDDWYGLPPILAAMQSGDIINAAHAWHASTLSNSARPSGILTVKGADKGLGVSMEAIKTQIQSWMGRNSQGKPAILGVPEGADVKWEQTALDAVDLSYLGGVVLNSRQVGIVFGVPSMLLGDVEASTFANVEESRKFLWEDTIAPAVLNFCACWNNTVAPRWGDGLTLVPVFDGIKALQANQETQAKWVAIAFNAGFLKQNEAREVMGFEAVEGGDRFAYEIEGLKKAATQPKALPAPADEPPAAPEEPPPGKAKGLRLVC